MERVGGIATVGRRVGERSGDVEELDDRTGPAVGDDQGVASGSGERMCAKCTRAPSISVVNCGHSFSRASAARQS